MWLTPWKPAHERLDLLDAPCVILIELELPTILWPHQCQPLTLRLTERANVERFERLQPIEPGGRGREKDPHAGQELVDQIVEEVTLAVNWWWRSAASRSITSRPSMCLGAT